MGSRYNKRTEQLIPKEGVYRELLDNRGIGKNGITTYASPEYNETSAEDMEVILHVWTIGDRFYKLSYKYYGSTKYWWIIAKYNKKPTETHVEIGDTLQIPIPAWKAIQNIKP